MFLARWKKSKSLLHYNSCVIISLTTSRCSCRELMAVHIGEDTTDVFRLYILPSSNVAASTANVTTDNSKRTSFSVIPNISRGGSRTVAMSKMEVFVIIVNGSSSNVVVNTANVTTDNTRRTSFSVFSNISRGGSRIAATSKIELFVMIVKVITKCSILDVAAVLDPPLISQYRYDSFVTFQRSGKGYQIQQPGKGYQIVNHRQHILTKIGGDIIACCVNSPLIFFYCTVEITEKIKQLNAFVWDSNSIALGSVKSKKLYYVQSPKNYKFRRWSRRIIFRHDDKDFILYFREFNLYLH